MAIEAGAYFFSLTKKFSKCCRTHSSGVRTNHFLRIASKILVCAPCFFSRVANGGYFNAKSRLKKCFFKYIYII